MAYKRIINGQLALGYGSKYQLLRMLGWHRNDFNKKIQTALGISDDITWLDFGYNGHCDRELLNLEFIPELNEEWRGFWSCGAGGINWDAVGVTDDGTYILVEAKAHLSEMRSSAAGSTRAMEKNAARIAEFMESYGITAETDLWCKNYYQLANRLVILDFLRSRGYKARLIYVLFENGFEYNRDVSDSASADEWQAEVKNELLEMGILGTRAEALIDLCIINCNPQ